MAHPFKLLFPILVTLFTASTITARQHSASSSSLPSHLKLDREGGNGEEEGSSKCWESLSQLQSCTNEVILFFLNGETYLGPSCCDAIETIEDQCWPAMLGSLGFTAEQGGILRTYCSDADSALQPPPTYAAAATSGATSTRLINTSVESIDSNP